jgi:phosphoesterase RecJ-like protein
VLIDHHLEPEQFADFTLWNTKASSTAELVYQLISRLDPENGIDLPIAECIYAGILTDTGGFRHPTTSRNVHIIIADLLNYGVDASRIHKLIYDTSTESRIRFLGYVLEQKLVVLQEYHCAFIVINKEELERFHSETGDTEGFVNYALSIEGIVMGAVIIDRTEAIKMSFRSVGDFSVNEFARKHFEGGGHKNAAGGKSDETLEETVARFVGLLPQYKEQLGAVARHYFESLK